MDKNELQELLVNAMGSLFAEAEIEAQIAETAGFSREEYNRLIEKGEEMPDCIKKYREINRQRKLYEEKIIGTEINQKLIDDTEKTDTCPPVIKSMIDAGVLKDIKNENEKYIKNDGYNDKKAIQWIINYSGYEDEITSEVYYKYVATKIKASSIDRYFLDIKNEAK